MVGLTGAALAEALGATLSAAGTAALAVAVLLRCLKLHWVRTVAICVDSDELRLLRWHTRSEILERPWPRPLTAAPPAGTEVIVYYHARRSDLWSLSSPHRHAWAVMAVGAGLVVASWLTPLVVR